MDKGIDKRKDDMSEISEDKNEVEQYLYDTALDIAKLINAYANNKEEVIELINVSLLMLNARFKANFRLSFEESDK